jgi:two-component system sensor histidine kinase SenX3
VNEFGRVSQPEAGVNQHGVQGLGVPDKYLQKIFERFFQMDPSRQRDAQRGNGLGLSICKSIVEQHGGEIFAVNVHNGLSLQVRIPLTTVP